MVPFAGYELPVHYGEGILAEHRHTREFASLFDVSHMGQFMLYGERAAVALETLVPGDIRDLSPWTLRYTVLTNEGGGILDDLMVANAGDHLHLVVNAAIKRLDLSYIRSAIQTMCGIEHLKGRAMVALQGPAAEEVLARFAPACRNLRFMTASLLYVRGIKCFVSRSGYTGEDGFEFSIAEEEIEDFAQLLLGESEVRLGGLGARDSLRLEAGLCLYGHDIDETTTPVEAGLEWVIGKRRRETGGFPGYAVIRHQLDEGTARRRVGLKPEGRAPAREGAEIRNLQGKPVGKVSSGGFGPTVGGPIAMGYVEQRYEKPGTEVDLIVRGTPRRARVVSLPFVSRGHRKG
jgi:aminomethyltransferase